MQEVELCRSDRRDGPKGGGQDARNNPTRPTIFSKLQLFKLTGCKGTFEMSEKLWVSGFVLPDSFYPDSLYRSTIQYGMSRRLSKGWLILMAGRRELMEKIRILMTFL